MGLEWHSSRTIGSVHSKVRKTCGSRYHQFSELLTDCVTGYQLGPTPLGPHTSPL